MIVEYLGNRRVLGSSLTGLALVLSSSVALGQQQPPGGAQQQAQQPSQQQQAQQPSQQQGQQQGQQPSQRQAQQPSQQAGRQQDVEIAAAAPGAAEAQPMLTGARIIEVKHDRIGDFEALLKELRTAAQESGQPSFTVWQTQLGELGTYHITASFDSFASMASEETPPMEPTEWANWLNRINETIDSHTVMVARMRSDLSILPQGAQAQQMPELLMLVTDRVMAGKSREYEAWLRDEIVPALRQSDVSTFVANEVVLGAEGRTWVFAVGLPGWEALDQPDPFVQALGPEGAQELMLRGDALIENDEMIVLRYRPDLSTGLPQ